MLAKLLVKPFGSIWKLKSLTQSNAPKPLLKFYKALYSMYNYENNSYIAWDSIFEGEPCMPHGEKGIFVSGGTKVGKNCIIFQQVTIGSVTLPDANSVGSPIVGDNCYIGAGAKIVGNVKIGNNVRIGANATVYKDVPDNSVVVSAVQKNIVKENPLINRYYSYNDDNNRWYYFNDGGWEEEKDIEILKSLGA